MPSATKSTKMTNGESSGLSAGKLSHIPEASNGVVDRFSQSAFADEPYFARARMQDRSAHVSRLSSQLDATEEILRK
ncbi:hypothetical protein IFM46972_09811 [Aspergillus udagawae]|uniref:Uncharacterized protein n=1 Tax=Aspergillus udagawae TaxID=91492 RepID=A0A8H3S8M8_9EURO|nr:uncharacterized protein Aud_004795 [Aspergillus udagawae]GFF48111.1 hypothetical protein IFM62136_00935 [Aspergillus lentulus]GFF53570.1 hypothetical protein IFM46972_09811 [Aspergillus udagawae]GFF93716.1 hypothetical protein IFM47457_09633 [Aspergillus lentulus]GIC88401.1 hypothetical protein Aud_004795 [Aspergillus udagawae]